MSEPSDGTARGLIASEDGSTFLAILIDRLSARVQAGEVLDADALAAEHPDYADDLHRLLPAIGLLGDLSRDRHPLPCEGGALGASGGRLGDFRIIREVGRGGMGIVYEAEQISLGRSVALKVLPFAATMDAKHLQRFKNEARAAASLEHEHIVPVYGVGSDGGVHYYAMKFIEGTTLTSLVHDMHYSTAPVAAGNDRATTQVVAELSTEDGRPGPAFFRTAARLMFQAAEALEHAHSMGVVHRDIKPGNLMLDAGGNLWVTDFGLARTAADAGLTMSGDLIGTLRYMSPEQALARHGLVDHRTDIYALGATLYELLTGQPVVMGDDRQEILRQIAFEEPLPPRKRNKNIPADLETIVLKAIEKNPADRYAGAKEIAEDLQRFLAGEPVRAKRQSIARRASKWARRHQAVVVTAMAAFVVLSVGLGVAVGNVTIAKREAQVREAETQAVLEFVEERIFAAARPKGMGRGLGHDVTLRQAVEAALPHVDADFADRPLIEARLRLTLGESFRHLGEDGIAMRQFQRAHELFAKHRGPDHPDTLTSLNKLANSLEAGGQADAALKLRFRTLERRRATLGADHPDTLDSANNLAISLDEVGRYDEALMLREDTLKRREAESGADHAETLTAMNNLAISYYNLGRHGEALELREKTLARQRTRDEPDTEGLLAGMNNLAESYHAAGRYDDARKLYENTLVEAKAKLTDRHPKTHLVMNNLAWLLATARDPKVRDAKRAIELAEAVVRLSPTNAGHHGTLGTARYRIGAYEQSALDLEKAIIIRGESDSINANESFFLAMARVQLGDKPGAREWFDKGVAWMNRSKSRTDEVRRFRAEAAELLGIKDAAKVADSTTLR